MNKKMDLDSFDVYAYIKTNHADNLDRDYVLVDHRTYHDASIRFPFRSFFHGTGRQPAHLLIFGSRTGVKNHHHNRHYASRHPAKRV